MTLRKALLLPLIMVITACTKQVTVMDNKQFISASGNPDDIIQVSPAMAHYSKTIVEEQLWERTELSKRDRSLITLASLIARNDRTEYPHYLNVALDNGVKPAEVSEIIAHLAFYSGWPNASAAAVMTHSVFRKRNITPDQLPGGNVQLLPIDKESESKRLAVVADNFGSVSPGVVKYTTDALFTDLWLRPGLAPRDRSLVTVSALITTGQVAQVTYHLNRAMDNGLTKIQAQETLTQLAFYAGWPNVFSAMPVVKSVFESRGV